MWEGEAGGLMRTRKRYKDPGWMDGNNKVRILRQEIQRILGHKLSVMLSIEE